MAAALAGVNTSVFCGGIGENAQAIDARNGGNAGLTSSALSRVTVLTNKGNEELVIAWAMRALVAS